MDLQLNPRLEADDRGGISTTRMKPINPERISKAPARACKLSVPQVEGSPSMRRVAQLPSSPSSNPIP